MDKGIVCSLKQLKKTGNFHLRPVVLLWQEHAPNNKMISQAENTLIQIKIK